MRAATATLAAVMCVHMMASGRRLRTSSVNLPYIRCDQMLPPPHKSLPVSVKRHVRSYIGRVGPVNMEAVLSPSNTTRP